jgi:hypothetical protein
MRRIASTPELASLACLQSKLPMEALAFVHTLLRRGLNGYAEGRTNVVYSLNPGSRGGRFGGHPEVIANSLI